MLEGKHGKTLPSYRSVEERRGREDGKEEDVKCRKECRVGEESGRGRYTREGKERKIWEDGSEEDYMGKKDVGRNVM